jgi:hypothetical protein
VFAHVGNPEDGASNSCTLVAELGQFLLRRPEALVVFLRDLWSFKTSAFLSEPVIWQVRAVINSGVGVTWTDAFEFIHQGPICRAVEGLRSRFPWERQLIGIYKNVETFFSKWANEGSRGRQLVTEAGGPEVSAVSERATSMRTQFPISSSART